MSLEVNFICKVCALCKMKIAFISTLALFNSVPSVTLRKATEETMVRLTTRTRQN